MSPACFVLPRALFCLVRYSASCELSPPPLLSLLSLLLSLAVVRAFNSFFLCVCVTRHLILDEADRMLDMGFEPQIRRIVEEEGACGRVPPLRCSRIVAAAALTTARAAVDSRRYANGPPDVHVLRDVPA